MASRLFLLALVVLLVGSACAMYDFTDEGREFTDDEIEEGYSMAGLVENDLHPIMELKRDPTRDLANKKYKKCHPVPGATQECWCFRRSGRIFYCFGSSTGK